MGLPDTFLQLVVAMGSSMTMPTLTSLVTVVQGWLFADHLGLYSQPCPPPEGLASRRGKHHGNDGAAPCTPRRSVALGPGL